MPEDRHRAIQETPTIGRTPDLPAPPAYGQRSVAEVLTSAAASLGVEGFTNTLGLPDASRVCVVLADGLGRNLLKQKAAHTPFLRSVIQAGQGEVPVWLDSAFPSTTAAALSSFGTGLPPGQHGMVGYDVLDPDQDKVVNLLGNWERLTVVTSTCSAALSKTVGNGCQVRGSTPASQLPSMFTTRSWSGSRTS